MHPKLLLRLKLQCCSHLKRKYAGTEPWGFPLNNDGCLSRALLQFSAGTGSAHTYLGLVGERIIPAASRLQATDRLIQLPDRQLGRLSEDYSPKSLAEFWVLKALLR